MNDRAQLSRAELFAVQSAEFRAELINGMPDEVLRQLEAEWSWWARPNQRVPPGNWRTWLVLAGRGFGKTRMGAEWVRAQAEANPRARIALVGATWAEVRRVMVEGESGLLAIAPPDKRPHWSPSLGELRWPGGARAHVYSAAEPDTLRGPQHHFAWADEIAKWAEGEATWDMLAMTLRLGKHPQVMATTTPRPVPLIRRLIADEAAAVTRGRTIDNRAHLAAEFLRHVRAGYQGTRLGRQELDGELIDDVAGALWTRQMLEVCRVRVAPAIKRVVVAVDPPAGIGGDACGIVAVALGEDLHGYILEDASISNASPEGWSRAVAGCAERHSCDRVVAEANNGGAMVRSLLTAADATLPITLVHASQGKVARAEPVAALYERGRVHHLGAFPALEDELCGLVTGGDYQGPGRSPDRADALVWGLTELMLGKRGQAAVRPL